MGRRLRATSQATCKRAGSSGSTWKTQAAMSREFCQSLQLPAGAIESVMHASPRSSFALAAGSVQAVLPGAVGTGQAAWLEANYVTLVLTAQFLFTVHTAPSAPLSTPATSTVAWMMRTPEQTGTAAVPGHRCPYRQLQVAAAYARRPAG
jgi:hypothetical protein